MDNYIIALDLGTSQIKAMTAVYDDQTEQMSVVHYESNKSQGIKRGTIINAAEAQKVVNNLLLGADKKINEVKVGRVQNSTLLSTDKPLTEAKAKRIRVPKVVCTNINGLNYKTIKEVVTMELAQRAVSRDILNRLRDMARSNRLQYLADDEELTNIVDINFSVDNEPSSMDVLGKQGHSITGTFLCYVANKAYTNVLRTVFGKMQLNTIFTTTQAKANILLDNRQKRQGTALVDLGYGTTNVAAYFGGSIRYEVSIPIGSDTITNDIAKGLNIDKNDAEFVKRRVGIPDENYLNGDIEIGIPSSGSTLTINAQKLAYIIKARLEEIGAYIYQALKEARDRGCSQLTLALTGGGSQLNNIETVLADATGCAVVPLKPNNFDGLEDGELTNYAATIGMIIDQARLCKMSKPKQSEQLDLPFADDNAETEANKEVEKETAANAATQQSGKAVNESTTSKEKEETEETKQKNKKGNSLFSIMKMKINGLMDDDLNSK